MATNVYIDGFNLYYGCVKGTQYRWLDLEAFCRQLLPTEEIKRIRYFTARVSGKQDVQAPKRQAVYLRALQTLPLVSIHYGHFLTTPNWAKLWYPPETGPKRVCVVKREEKGSDVNLACNLLLDGFRNDCDTVVIVSNDSDLVEPVRIARYELGLRVGVINPHPAQKRSRELSSEVHFFKQVRPSALAASQFPPSMTDHRGTFFKPTGW